MAEEDHFVLQQAKKKAEIRVRSGRARPIDWLAVTLRGADQSANFLDEETDEKELETVDPEALLDGLDSGQLTELERDVNGYLTLEKQRENIEFWNVSHPYQIDGRQLMPCTRQ